MTAAVWQCVQRAKGVAAAATAAPAAAYVPRVPKPARGRLTHNRPSLKYIDGAAEHPPTRRRCRPARPTAPGAADKVAAGILPRHPALPRRRLVPHAPALAEIWRRWPPRVPVRERPPARAWWLTPFKAGGGRPPLGMLQRTAATAQAHSRPPPPPSPKPGCSCVQSQADPHSGSRPAGGAGAASRRSLCVRPPVPLQRALHPDPRAAARRHRPRWSTGAIGSTGTDLAQRRSSPPSPIDNDGVLADVDDTVVGDPPRRGW